MNNLNGAVPYQIICDDRDRLRVDFDLSWTENTVNITPETNVLARFVSQTVHDQFFSELYIELSEKFAGKNNTEDLRRLIAADIRKKFEDYQDRGLLK